MTKMFGWEGRAQEDIAKKRNEELDRIWSMKLLILANNLIKYVSLRYREILLIASLSFTIPVVHLGEPSPMFVTELALTKLLSRDFRDFRASFIHKFPGRLFTVIRNIDPCNEVRTQW